MLGVHAEVSATVRDKFVSLFKSVVVQQKQHPLPRRQLARAMLPLPPLRAAAFFRCGVAAFQFIQLFV